MILLKNVFNNDSIIKIHWRLILLQKCMVTSFASDWNEDVEWLCPVDEEKETVVA